jgi:hypothetical protein
MEIMWNFNPFLANLFSILSQSQNHWWKTPISVLLLPFHRRLSQHKQASGRKQRKSGAQERGRGASTYNLMALGAGVFPVSNQEGEMIVTLRQSGLL